jgi:hypothetical protein
MTESVIVIGAGRIGTALAARHDEHGRPPFVLVDRERGWERLDAGASGPIMLAVRNDDLEAVIARVPKSRHGDLVFVQNGMLRPWLEDRGLAGATRGLLFLAVPSVGAAIELEKLIWNSAFGLFCQALDCDVGTVVEQHRPRLRLLVAELLAVGGPELGVELELDPLVERLCEYSRSIPRYRGAVKEWPWRNGWFVSTARTRKIRTPTHDMLLLAIGKFGK